MTTRRSIHTAAAPAAIGPYSQAIVAAGLVHCSGQVGFDPESGLLVGGEDVRVQARQALSNLVAVLEAAGSSPAKVIKCNVYLKDMRDFGALNEVYAEFFVGDDPPARACVEVARLPKDALVEVDCVASVD